MAYILTTPPLRDETELKVVTDCLKQLGYQHYTVDQVPVRSQPKLVKDEEKKKKGKRYVSNPENADLSAGGYAVDLEVLSDGQWHRPKDMKDACAAAGLERKSAGWYLREMAKIGVVELRKEGTKAFWRATTAGLTIAGENRRKRAS
jgi:hypothetical protein